MTIKKYILIVVALFFTLLFCVAGYYYFSHSKQTVIAENDNPYVPQIIMAEKEAIRTFESTDHVGMAVTESVAKYISLESDLELLLKAYSLADYARTPMSSQSLTRLCGSRGLLCDAGWHLSKNITPWYGPLIFQGREIEVRLFVLDKNIVSIYSHISITMP